jgi:hypothetical protein
MWRRPEACENVYTTVNDDRNNRKHFIMENIQYSNGLEGAKNPSKQNNGSDRQPPYQDALAKCFGCEDLAGPVTKVQDGVKYAFDFYDAQENIPIKVLNADTLEEHAKYAAYSGDKLILLDAEGLDCQTMPIGNGNDRLLGIRSDINQYARDGGSACLYYDGQLWVFQDRTKSGMTLWHSVPEVVLDEDSNDGDED